MTGPIEPSPFRPSVLPSLVRISKTEDSLVISVGGLGYLVYVTAALAAETHGTGDEPGRFSFPAGIAAHPDGRIAVVDSLNRRVQVFRLVGAPPGRR